MPPIHTALAALAEKLPDTDEGIACAGTAVESRTIRTGGKAFLFIRAADARLKLGASVPEIAAMAAKHPDHYQTGAGGWSKITFANGHTLDQRQLKRWITESYGLFAGPASQSKPAGRGKPAKVAASTTTKPRAARSKPAKPRPESRNRA